MDRVVDLLMQTTGAKQVPLHELKHTLASLHPTEVSGLLGLARSETLITTVEAHLREKDLLDTLPDHARAELSAAAEQNSIRYLQHAYVLRTIAAALEAEGIPFRILKGMALGALAYPAPDARETGDLDIWVLPQHTTGAIQSLTRLGIKANSAPAYSHDFLFAYGKELVFPAGTNAKAPVTIDMHWRPLAPWWFRAIARIPEAALFDRYAEVRIAGSTYRTLEPTYNLWYLCAHAALGHRFEGLRWVVDVARLQNTHINWAHFNHLVRYTKTQALIWRAFSIVDEMTNTGLSAHLSYKPTSPHRKLLLATLPGYPSARQLDDPDQADIAFPLDQMVLLQNIPSLVVALRLMLWPPDRWIKLRYSTSATRHRALLPARLKHLARLRHLLKFSL